MNLYFGVEIETLVAVAQHRNQYYSHGGKANSPIRFGSLLFKGFRDINCRTFESGVGLLEQTELVQKALQCEPIPFT